MANANTEYMVHATRNGVHAPRTTGHGEFNLKKRSVVAHARQLATSRAVFWRKSGRAEEDQSEPRSSSSLSCLTRQHLGHLHIQHVLVLLVDLLLALLLLLHILLGQRLLLRTGAVRLTVRLAALLEHTLNR